MEREGGFGSVVRMGMEMGMGDGIWLLRYW
jgi:hypothetical protein